MHGGFQRKLLEERRARILEASRLSGPIGARLIATEEKIRIVRCATEQRRLLQEAGLEPPRDVREIVERAAAQFHQIAAHLMAPKTTISPPDHACR